MSKRKLTETIRRLEAQQDAKEGVVPEVELTMYENPWLSYGALDHIRKFGDPAQGRELEWALKEYGTTEAQSPEEYWMQQEELDADEDY